MDDSRGIGGAAGARNGRTGGAPRRRISYTPALPDGEDCPWTRGRSTRWWLVLPADLVAVALVAAFSAASARALDQAPSWAAQGAVSVALGWAVTWLVARRRAGGHHLELAWPQGALVVGVSAAAWTLIHAVLCGGRGLGDWVGMTLAFLVVFLGGWRWLYGYVKAHDSLVPRGVARRIAEQEAADAGGPKNPKNTETPGRH
ncbi:DUF3054 domain-containing protein [Actinomyces oricola]